MLSEVCSGNYKHGLLIGDRQNMFILSNYMAVRPSLRFRYDGITKRVMKFIKHAVFFLMKDKINAETNIYLLVIANLF